MQFWRVYIVSGSMEPLASSGDGGVRRDIVGGDGTDDGRRTCLFLCLTARKGETGWSCVDCCYPSH